jgi:tyrosinase
MANGVRMRENVAEMDADHPTLRDYAKAVRIMKERLPASDRRSWTQQANIHRDFCPHGNWFFVPWHRAYILYFEEICQELSENPDFALPYWNWTDTRSIPAPFWQPPLLDTTRRKGPTDQLGDEIVGQPIIDRILRQTEFELFASFKPTGQNNVEPRWQRQRGAKAEMERTPHDQTHNWINGNMATLLSPLDPIFWLHHANVDRLWAEWNARGHRNTGDALWTQFPFDRNYVDRRGNPVARVLVGDLQDIEQLGYTYDSLPRAHAKLAASLPVSARPSALPPLLERSRERYTSRQQQTAVLGQAASISVETPVSPVERVAESRKMAANAAREGSPRVIAFLRGVHPPADLNVTVNVYLNCPYLSADTPTADPHYVGNFTFFGLHGDDGGDHDHGGGVHAHQHHGGHEMKLDFAFDVTNAVERLSELEPDIRDRLTVQFVPVPIPGFEVGPVEVTVDEVEIVYV